MVLTMNAEVEEYSAAVDYYCRIMIADDTLRLKDLAEQICKKKFRAEPVAKHYLQRNCRTVQILEEFFRENSHYFFVQNGRVALYDEELEEAANMAENYFKEMLNAYEGPVHFMTLKKEHLGRAPDAVGNFITRFYPGKEFKHFLRSRPDVFTVGKDHKVFLIEIESVAFFEKRLTVFGRENLRFIDFRGHVGQAPLHIQDYINRKYPDDDFQTFLRRHPDVFRINESGIISLVPL